MIDFRTDITIELLDECYFEGQRVSQVINSNINQLLVALWDDPGYYKIERRQYDKKTTYISDTGNIENNIHCTDLIQISSENEENMSYNHYFISRTESAINVVDIVREKIYCLYQEKNNTHKFRKATIIPRDLLVKGAHRDRIQYQLVYATETEGIEQKPTNFSNPTENSILSSAKNKNSIL